MRIATLQVAPQVGDLGNNFRRADELLKQLESRCQQEAPDGSSSSLDLLVLPEMAFTGYNFASSEHIAPYLEPVGKGRSCRWAMDAASQLGCVVAVGYPEIVTNGTSSSNDGAGNPPHSSRFNSLFITSPTKKTLANYQKRFLYYTDDRWAKEGQNGKGFFSMPLPSGRRLCFASDALELSRGGVKEIPTAMGICMDINPYKFEAPWDAYEFATHVTQSGARLVILSMAWLTTLDEVTIGGMRSVPDMDTFKYWILRFWPLFVRSDTDGSESEDMTIIVFANRSGIERGSAPGIDDAIYAGSSCVVGVRPRGPGGEAVADIYVWDMLGAAEEGVLFVDTERKPTSVFSVGHSSSGSD